MGAPGQFGNNGEDRKLGGIFEGDEFRGTIVVSNE